ncbi:MAG: hypothetical protein ACI9K5_002162, partial [Gammaproteobacteria bacterium]
MGKVLGQRRLLIAADSTLDWFQSEVSDLGLLWHQEWH